MRMKSSERGIEDEGKMLPSRANKNEVRPEREREKDPDIERGEHEVQKEFATNETEK